MTMDSGGVLTAWARTKSKIPIGRLGKPDEIASIVLMLATNGYMTNKVTAERRLNQSWAL